MRNSLIDFQRDSDIRSNKHGTITLSAERGATLADRKIGGQS